MFRKKVVFATVNSICNNLTHAYIFCTKKTEKLWKLSQLTLSLADTSTDDSLHKTPFELAYDYFSGADPVEVKWVNFHPPFSEPHSFQLPRLCSIALLQKFTPPFQNPGSAPATLVCERTFS